MRRIRVAALAALVACQFPKPGEHGGGGLGGDGGDDAGGASCRVLAAAPAVANSSHTVAIEGDFAGLGSATVVFPSGATSDATTVDTHVLTVEDVVGAGGGTLSVAGCSGSAAFRETSFTVGLGPVQVVDDQADGARQQPALVDARAFGAAVATDRCVFAVGGNAGASDVEAAPINADGTLGAFTLGPALITSRTRAAAIVADNALYVVGGAGGSGSGVPLTGGEALERATIGANCVLASFTQPSTAGLTTPHVQPAVAVIGNRLYVAGGGTQVIESASLDDDALTFTSGSNVALAAPRTGAVSMVTGSQWFVFGGAVGSGEFSYEALPIGADGTVGSGPSAKTVAGNWGSDTVGATVDNLFVTLGGPAGSVVATFSVDPSSGAVTATSSNAVLPAALGNALTPVVAGNSLYILGGVGSANLPQSSVWRSSITGSASLGGNPSIVELTAPRFDFATAVVGDDLALIGGFSSSGLASSALATDEVAGVDADSLTSFASGSDGAARGGIALATVGGDVYAFGGTGTFEGAASNGSLVATDTGAPGPFEAGQGMAHTRAGAAALVTGGQVYVIGGLGSAGAQTSIDTAPIGIGPLPGLGSGSGTPALATARAYFGAAVAGQRFYAAGGCKAALPCGSNAVITVEGFSIGPTGQLGSSAFGSLITTRVDPAMVVLASQLCVLGGADNTGSALASVICYPLSPTGALGTSTTTLLPTARIGGRAVVLGNNLYYIGGVGSGNVPLASYDIIPLVDP